MSKGSNQRPSDKSKFEEGYTRIFNKQKKTENPLASGRPPKK